MSDQSQIKRRFPYITDDYDVNIVYTDYNYIFWTQCSMSAPDGGMYYQIFIASRFPEQDFPTNLKDQFLSLLSEDYAVKPERLTAVPQGVANNCPLENSDDLDPTTTTESNGGSIFAQFSYPILFTLSIFSVLCNWPHNLNL